MSAPDYSADDYLAQLQALLPRGAAWPRDAEAPLTQLLRGFATTLARANARANHLLVVAFPSTVDDMLAEWNETLGLPGLTGYTGDDLATQQALVVAALTATGGQSSAYFTALAESLGIPIEVSGYRPYRVNDHVNDNIYGKAWAHAWLVTVLSTGDYTSLKAILSRYKPAHTTVLYAVDPAGNYELREDGTFELREDGSFEVRE